MKFTHRTRRGLSAQSVLDELDIKEDVFASPLGGIERHFVQDTVVIDDDVADADTDIAIPSGARIVGVHLRVESAFEENDEWDADFIGGSTDAIAAEQAVAAGTTFNALLNIITDDETEVQISKNGGGTFAEGTNAAVTVVVYYETIEEIE